MLGYKERDFQTCVVSLEALVPEDNFYRQVNAKLDLTFVRGLVRHLYKPYGRSSIDPVVFFKLQLIMFFEDVRSERQLMEIVAMRLDCRWYLGYDLDERLPDHSSLTYIRNRFGLEAFQRFFERIVELCILAGLVRGKELYFDATQVRANASMDSLAQRVQLHLVSRFPQPRQADTQGEPISPMNRARNLVEKYNGARIADQKPSTSYLRVADVRVSTTDPDATPMKPGFVGYARLGYQTHYVVDGGKARIILATLVTPASVMENTPMLDLACWTRFRWQLQPDIAVADSMFGSGYNLAGLEQDGIRAYIHPHNESRRQQTTYYPRELFTYVGENNRYICPEGEPLPYKFTSMQWRAHFYRAKKSACDACPVQTQCRRGKYGRSVKRLIYQDYIDRVEGYLQTAAYKKAMRKRQVWIEPKFGEIKQWHQGRRFRLRGLWKVNTEGLIKAAGQNIKQLLKAEIRKMRPNPPANIGALRLFPMFFPATHR
jgi:transposase